MNNIKIKFCGLFREEDIEYVNKLNPDYIGFVFAKSKRQVSIKQAIKLKSKLNTNIKAVGVFVNEDIEKVSNGNITERALDKKQKEYNDSLDFLDGNVKYSKYVIYIDPQNVDFIDSLTVKERKNLINKILREQDDITITKQRFQKAQTIIKHAIVAILTIAISIPVIYYTINASLEASINNYRRSQSMFQTLYKQGGKIKSVR